MPQKSRVPDSSPWGYAACMHDAESATQDSLAKQRRAGMIAIAVSMPVALLLWLAVACFAPPLTAMDDLSARMLFTLKCLSVAVLFSLVLGVEAVAHERL